MAAGGVLTSSKVIRHRNSTSMVIQQSQMTSKDTDLVLCGPVEDNAIAALRSVVQQQDHSLVEVALALPEHVGVCQQ